MTINVNERLKNTFITNVANLTLVEKSTGYQLESVTLKDLSVEFTEETKEIKGGRGNTTLLTWNTDRQINVKLTDVAIRMDWIAAKLGQEIKKGSVPVLQESKIYTVGTSKRVTLDSIPIVSTDVKVFDVATGEPLSSDIYTITGGEITLTGESGLPSEILVYAYNTLKTATYIDIKHDTFAKNFEAYISIPLMEKLADGQLKATMVKQYYFPQAQLSGGFSENTSSAGDGAEIASELKITKPTHGDMGRITVFDIGELSPTQEVNMLGELAGKKRK